MAGSCKNRLFLRGLLLLVLVAVCACGSSKGGTATSGPAADAVKTFINYLSKGQYGPAWDLLHPAQQAIVPRDLYVRCAQAAFQGAAAEVKVIKVLEVHPERIAIPGTNTEVASTAVQLRVELAAGGHSQESTETFQAIQVGGAYRLTLADPEPYKNGQCPS